MSLEQKENLLDYVEKFSMTLLHQVLFCPVFTNDEEMDLTIQRRCVSVFREAISWVEFSMILFFPQNTPVKLDQR